MFSSSFFRRSFHSSCTKAWFWRTPKSSVPALYKVREEPWLAPTMVLVGIMPFFAFGLGTWQLQRLRWKVDLIDELEEKLQLFPLSLPNKINLSVIPEFVFRRVFAKGRWDHAHTMLLSPRVRDGVHGFHVITPLIRDNGSTILVDRGFVPREFLGSIPKPEENEVEVLGMIRMSQDRNLFTPDNKPDEGKWYWTDVQGMAKYAGGEKAGVQPVLLEEIFEGHAGEAHSRLEKGIPVGRLPTVELRNSHLSYVITWYSLSAFTAFMFFRLLAAKRKSPGRRMPRFG